jgi:hypothetical protein
MIGAAHGFGVAGHALRATVLPFGHQLSTFQHGHVLLHRGKRHRVSRSQLADRRVGVHHARQDVSPGGIGQRSEQVVQVVGRRLRIYNHMVVDSSTPALHRLEKRRLLRAECDGRSRGSSRAHRDRGARPVAADAAGHEHRPDRGAALRSRLTDSRWPHNGRADRRHVLAAAAMVAAISGAVAADTLSRQRAGHAVRLSGGE